MSNHMAALFRTISCGVYVIGAAHGKRQNAFTAAWVSQVSFNPLMLALSVNPKNASYPLIKVGRAFTVNVLAQGQLNLARHFGTKTGRKQRKLEGHAWLAGGTGSPILNDAVSYFDCRLLFTRRVGDHVLVVGQVVDGALINARAVPMNYVQTGNMDGSDQFYSARF
jgi:flavin reductase (DIM6/NTAB) family NADH-FMN oxidoreductase RutF